MTDDLHQHLLDLLDVDAKAVISNALRFGPRIEGVALAERAGAFGPITWQAADQAARDVVANLVESGRTVVRPPRLGRRTVDALLGTARQAWEQAEGDADTEAGLRAVIAALTLDLAFELGAVSGARARRAAR